MQYGGPPAPQQQYGGAPPYGASPYGAPPAQYGAPPAQYGAPPGAHPYAPPPMAGPPPYYGGAPPPQAPMGGPPPYGYGAPPPGPMGPPMMAPQPQEMQHVGPADANPLLDGYTAAMFSQMRGITVVQKVNFLEAMTCGIIERANQYTIHPGIAIERGAEGPPVLVADEMSDFCNRCCCNPDHSLFLEFRPTPGGFIPPQPNLAVPPRHVPPHPPLPVMTMEREGCCGKWVCCWACADCCLDGMTLHAGHVTGDPGEVVSSNVIGHAKQPRFGGMCTPTVDMTDGANAPIGVVQGPCLFGGCAEFCCDSSYTVDKPGTDAKIGDMAVIIKRKPQDLEAACTEMCTDSDIFTIEFKDPNLTPQQKATILGSTLLLDYMFFEDDGNMFSCRNNEFTINCCMCFCIGCVCPCSITCSGNNGGGGGE